MSSGGSPIRLMLFEPWPRFDRSGLYRRLAADPRLAFTAVYASSAGVRPGEIGFGGRVAFDADTLSGFESVFLRRADRVEHTGELFSLFDPDIVPLLLRSQPEVLWLHGYYSATHLMAAATQALAGRRLLIREEQTLLDPRPWWKLTLKRVVLRLLFSRAHGLYQGSRNRSWFAHYGMPESRLYNVPICVDNEHLRSQARALGPRKKELRRSFGIADDAGPVILMVGRLIAKKRPLLLLDAFRRVRSAQRCALLVVGSGECEDELRRFVASQRVPDVTLAGFLNQSELPRAYAAADVLVLPSSWQETWGLVVNEGMNFGLPAVVSDRVGCAGDLVRDGSTGFVFRHDDAADLARVLERLVTDEPLRDMLGANAAAVVEPWNYDNAAGELVRAVRGVVGEARWRSVTEGPGEPLREAV